MGLMFIECPHSTMWKMYKASATEQNNFMSYLSLLGYKYAHIISIPHRGVEETEIMAFYTDEDYFYVKSEYNKIFKDYLELTGKQVKELHGSRKT